VPGHGILASIIMSDQTAAQGVALITRHLKEWREGDETALTRLTSSVYAELRRLAAIMMSRHAATPTIQPTALVHELYLSLPDVQSVDWQSRAHFLNVAAKMMRNILVDHARKRNALKRGGGIAPLDADVEVPDPAISLDVILIDQALEKFAASYPRQSRVVELRFFGGLTTEETTEVLRETGIECSSRTVERDWTFARAWLKNEIAPE